MRPVQSPNLAKKKKKKITCVIIKYTRWYSVKTSEHLSITLSGNFTAIFLPLLCFKVHTAITAGIYRFQIPKLLTFYTVICVTQDQFKHARLFENIT